MTRRDEPEPARRWWRPSAPWPLTRQIATIFTAVMIGNAILISTAIDLWSDQLLSREIGSLSPQSQRTYAQLEQDEMPSPADLTVLSRDFERIQARLEAQTDAAFYAMIAIAGLVTMVMGYWLLGRVGRGLGSVAAAARRIADGDLTARASPVAFASREETALIRDFNDMSATLQRSERELAESTASIAHELRTPLTILRGRLHGIADGVFALEATEIEGLLYQVEGLGRLVDDLQTVSLASSQRLRLALAETDLADEVRRVLASVTPDLAAAGLEPCLALAPAPVLCDGARIRQLISAVLANACRYAALTGQLDIITDHGEGSVRLRIIDRGPGLPEAAVNRAFDRFWRGEASRSRDSGGTGLGLSVVKAIADAHGGAVDLRNNAECGTCFTLTLLHTPR